jgi:hypothetical protein
MADQPQTTERIAFSEEGVGGTVRLIACGDIDESLLDALVGFIDRQRKRKFELDGDWAE